MKIQFLGANRQVTGSRYCLTTDKSQILVDCGMFQERAFEHRNWECCPVPAGGLDCVVLTHAHIDHCGLLPRLAGEGFHGPIYTTHPSEDLTRIMLKDAAKIQMEDVKYKERRHKKEGRTGSHPYVPLFDEDDAEKSCRQLKGVNYYERKQLTEDVAVTFHDAGHILGSASLEFTITTSAGERTFVFSGDIGQWGKPLIRDPSLFRRADYVVMESTYGNRVHENGGDVSEQLAAVIRRTAARGGKVVIPTFAVERAQELIYYIARLVHDERIPDISVYLDSPMAVDVVEVFRENKQAYDEETWNLIAKGMPPLHFRGLHLIRSAKESKAINEVREPAVIMSTSGMCTSGRIKHHLRHHISNERNTILFVGYQGVGTLGRQILDGNREVRIHGRSYEVRAEVTQIYGFSGHADRPALLRWVDSFDTPPKQLFLTHGDEDSAESLALEIRNRNRDWNVLIPQYKQVVELE
ncbi:MAG: MBL fold metallo-hydrolase [Planctomycetales bacterium]|nr:MBL fold metallo-hydrolase [Planctomycetales bacterium]